MSESRIEVHPDASTLATAVAGELIARLEAAQASGHVPQIGLTGGTIAEAVHREVARLSPSSDVDWSRVVVWFGDERFVAPESPDRNAGQARQRQSIARQGCVEPEFPDAGERAIGIIFLKRRLLVEHRYPVREERQGAGPELPAAGAAGPAGPAPAGRGRTAPGTAG